MDNILVWNIRGLNNCVKQHEVRKFITSHNIKLFSLLETRVKAPKMGQVYTHLCPGWCFTHNNSCHSNGRIVVGWWPESYQVNIKWMQSQFIHCEIKPKQGGIAFHCTFVYGFNDQMSREDLWQGLRMIARDCTGPWVVMGDFNALSSVEDRIGAVVRVGEIAPMLSCFNDCGLVDIKATGRHFTWNNKQEGEARVYSRIDRVLVTSSWLEAFELAEVVFLPEGNFDHSPALLSFYPETQQKQPFQVLQLLVQLH